MPWLRNFGNVLRPARETIQPHVGAQKIGGSHGDVAATNQQYPDHTLQPPCGAKRRNPFPSPPEAGVSGEGVIFAARRPAHRSHYMPHQITIKPSDHSFACR